MIYGEAKVKKSIRWGMIGGGYGSAIGYIHRSAALRDRNLELLAAVLDVVPEKGKEFGAKLGIETARCYENYQELIAQESQRADGIQAVTIATPNFTHFPIAKAALEAGLHVVCEKPLSFTTEESQILVDIAAQNNKVLAVTYGYAGHQMIHQARAMVKNGDIGDIRIVNMQFSHGGNSKEIEKNVSNQKWRVDPKIAGPSFVLDDLGIHMEYLLNSIAPDLKIKRLLCSKQSFIKSRAPLEDNAYVLMEYENGAVGNLWTSSVNCGAVFGNKIRIIGSDASLEWDAERPNQLRFEPYNEPVRILERGLPYLYEEARDYDRIGGGHPEGLFEAWSNLYARFALAMQEMDKGNIEFVQDFWYPDGKAAMHGVKLVEKCVESAAKDSAWIDF